MINFIIIVQVKSFINYELLWLLKHINKIFYQNQQIIIVLKIIYLKKVL